MDSRFRYAAASGRRSPPLHNPARASMPAMVGAGAGYGTVFGADHHAARFDDPVTPRSQPVAVDYRTAPSVPTPPQLSSKQQQQQQQQQQQHLHQQHLHQQPPPPPLGAASASSAAATAGQPSHHVHAHAAHAHAHHHAHPSSMPPPVAKAPVSRSTSLREPARNRRTSVSEAGPKRPIIITTTTTTAAGAAASSSASAAAASGPAVASRGPPSPSRAELPRGPLSTRDDSRFYVLPASSAALRTRGTRASYSGATMSATLDNDDLHRLRERHDLLFSAPRVGSAVHHRLVPASVGGPGGPRHASAAGLSGPPASSASTTASGVPPSASLASSGGGGAATSYGDQGYEYTKPSDLARYDLAHEPTRVPRRARRDSFDRNYYRPTVSLATDLGRPYPFHPASAAAGSGPPPTTWGLDKIGRAGPASGAVPAVPGSAAAAATAYDSPVPSMRPPPPPSASAALGDHIRHPEHAAGGLAPPSAGGSSGTRSSSRPRAPPLYRKAQDDFQRDRDYRDRDYRDRDYRDCEYDDREYRDPRDPSRGYGRGHAAAQDRSQGKDRDGREREHERERPTAREHYADGTVANRASGLLVNSRDYQLRQAQLAAGTAARNALYGDYRSSYADDGRHDDARYSGIDREFVRGRPDQAERLGIESPRRKETEDDLYVHHPQEGMHHWDSHVDRHDRYDPPHDRRARGTEPDRDRDRDRDPEWETERDRERESGRKRTRAREPETRPPRKAADLETANTKKARDGARGDTREASRQDHSRDTDGSPPAGSDGRYSSRRLSTHDVDAASEDSDMPARAAIAPTSAPGRARVHPGAGSTGPTHRADQTPSTSEDGDSSRDAREPQTRKQRQRATASFVSMDVEDLKALKADLAAQGATEGKAMSSASNQRAAKDSRSWSPDEGGIDDPAEDGRAGHTEKMDKAEVASSGILTPSTTTTTSSSAPPSPMTEHAEERAEEHPEEHTGSLSTTATASKGKGKERDAHTDDALDRRQDQALPEIVSEPDDPSLGRGRDQSQSSSKGLAVRLVSPPREKDKKKPLKGILKAPSTKFPEDLNPVREGVAPHKDDKAKQQGVPPGARWTRISRKLVNPEALTIGKERFEVRDDFVIVLRVLSREEIEAYTIATAQLRSQHRKEFEQLQLSQREHEEEYSDGDHHRHRPCHDRGDGHDRGDEEYYGEGGSSSNKDRQRRHRRHASENRANDGAGSQPAVEYHSTRGSNRKYFHQ